MSSKGTVYVKFGDLRDAEAAYRVAKAHRPGWHTRYMSPKDLALKLQLEKPTQPTLSMYEGQVLITAEYEESPLSPDVEAVAGHVKQFLGNFGDLMAFNLVMMDDIASTYRAEFYDTSAVKGALNVNGFRISVNPDSLSGTCSELTYAGVHLEHLTLRTRCGEYYTTSSTRPWPSHYQSRFEIRQRIGEYDPKQSS